MSCKRAMVAAVFVAALAACSNGLKETGASDPFLGEAVRYNAAVQTINPDPVYTADAAKPGDNGDKGAAAVKRYRTDKVKDVQTLTTTVQSGGSTPPR